MPVAGVTGGEGPLCTIECQTSTYVDILDDVVHVAVVHKVVPMNGPVNAGVNKREDKANEKLLFHRTFPRAVHCSGGLISPQNIDHCFFPKQLVGREAPQNYYRAVDAF